MFISSKAKVEDINRYDNLRENAGFAERLWAIEARTGFSRRKLATMSGVSDTAINNWEAGNVDQPSKEKVIRLCWACCLSESETQELLGSLGLILNPNLRRDKVYIEIVKRYSEKSKSAVLESKKMAEYVNFLGEADDILFDAGIKISNG